MSLVEKKKKKENSQPINSLRLLLRRSFKHSGPELYELDDKDKYMR